MPNSIRVTTWRKRFNPIPVGEVRMDSPDKSNEFYLKGLIAMMEHLSEPWGIKDLASRHLYMNRAAYLYTNTPLNFDIAGKRDDEFPADWAESAADFVEHDKMTEISRDRVAVIE